MSKETDLVMRGNKCAHVILNLCNLYNLSLKEASDLYYRSQTAMLIEQRVADLHCRSSKYLATLIWDEHLGL